MIFKKDYTKLSVGMPIYPSGFALHLYAMRSSYIVDRIIRNSPLTLAAVPETEEFTFLDCTTYFSCGSYKYWIPLLSLEPHERQYIPLKEGTFVELSREYIGMLNHFVGDSSTIDWLLKSTQLEVITHLWQMDYIITDQHGHEESVFMLLFEPVSTCRTATSVHHRI